MTLCSTFQNANNNNLSLSANSSSNTTTSDSINSQFLLLFLFSKIILLKYYHKLNKIAILSKKDFIFTFQASLICFRSRGKIRFFFLRLQDCYGCVQGYRPRRERGRRQLLRSRQQTREDPDAVQHAPLHRKVSTFLDV